MNYETLIPDLKHAKFQTYELMELWGGGGEGEGGICPLPMCVLSTIPHAIGFSFDRLLNPLLLS